MEYVVQYAPLVLFSILAVTLVLGMLYGLWRGAKQSAIRLAVVTTFILVIFLLTPVLSNAVYHLPIPIGGYTPSGWVDEIVKLMQESESMQYMTPFVPYITDFAVALVFAIINLILFLALYLIFKPISWIVFKVIAVRVAPNKDEDGNKLPKNRWGGLGIGLAQGVILFFFFMIPLNGALNMVHEIADYRVLGGNEVAQTQSIESDENHQGFDPVGYCRELTTSLDAYYGIMRYTGMEFLTDRAFDYQTTARVSFDRNTKIHLRKDVVGAMQLAGDWHAFNPVMERTQKIAGEQSMPVALSQVSHAEYEAARYMVNKLMRLELLKLGDVMLGDLDKIMSTSYNGDQTLLAGTDVKAASFYGLMAKSMADESNRAEFITGVKAMVHCITEEKLDLVRNDLINVIDIVEDLATTKINFPNAEQAQPVLVAMTRQKLNVVDYLNILLSDVDEERTALDLIYDDILDLSIFKILTQPKADYCLRYSNFFNGMDTTTGLQGTEKLMRDFSSSFLGEGALDENGAWDNLRKTLKAVMGVVREFVNIVDDINRLQDEARADPEIADEKALPQAIINYLSGLLDRTEGATEDQKYAKVDRLAVGLNRIVFSFEPITEFMKLQVDRLALGEFNSVFTKLLNTPSETTWKTTFRSLVGVTDMLANNEIVKDIMSIDFTQENAVQQLMETLTDVNPEEIADIAFGLLQIDSIGGTVDQAIQNLDFGYEADSPVGEKVTELKDYLNTTMKDENVDDDVKKAQLEDLVKDLWQQIDLNQNNGGAGD